MANHARIFSQNIPTFEELKAKIQEFVDSFQGLLSVEISKGNYFLIGSTLDENFHRVEVWLSESRDESKVNWSSEEDINWESLPMVPCIEFRHGHGHDLFWYLDGKLEQYLAEVYDGIIIDEGVGLIPRDRDRYQSFRHYKDCHRKFHLEACEKSGRAIEAIFFSLLDWISTYSLGWSTLPNLEKEILERDL